MAQTTGAMGGGFYQQPQVMQQQPTFIQPVQYQY
jgi:hypothetical protein